MTFFQPPEAHHDAQPDHGGWGETVRTFIYAVVIALFVRTFLYEPFNIPSGSMIPTLLIGDYLFVSKFSYGYSKYTVGFGIPLFQGRIFGHPPERGDVIVFKKPSDNKTDYIKRLIGLPGDRIQMIHGVLQINGAPVGMQRVGEHLGPGRGNGYQAQIVLLTDYIETLPGGKVHRIQKQEMDGALDNTPIYVVPPHHYFMMGDNRDNSLDSRVPMEMEGVGFVPEENLVGRAEFLFFSLDNGTPFWELWRWPFDVRGGRLLQGVN